MRPGRPRGPRKGDGGRPRGNFENDRDRFVLALAWLIENQNADDDACLKLADMLLCENENAAMEPPSQERPGHVGFSVVNRAGDVPAGVRSDARRRGASPRGSSLWRSRLRTLKEKKHKYQLLDERGAQWLKASMLGLKLALRGAGGDRISGLEILKIHGWQLSSVVLARLRRWAEIMQAEHCGILRVGDLALVVEAPSPGWGSVIRIEDAFRIST